MKNLSLTKTGIDYAEYYKSITGQSSYDPHYADFQIQAVLGVLDDQQNLIDALEARIGFLELKVEELLNNKP